LTVKKEKIDKVKDELEAFKLEHGIKLKYVKPSATTSFMARRTSCQNFIQANKTKYAK
jgi:hypothetical protein